jgi:hypothetical protein
LASLVGITGDLKDEDSEFGDGSWHGWAAGANVDLFGFKLAGSYADEKVGDADRNWFTLGVGWGFGPVNTSVNYSQMLDTSDNFAAGGSASNLVFSADVPIAPGLVLAGDLGIFDNDARPDNGYVGGDEGWQAVGRLGLAF